MDWFERLDRRIQGTLDKTLFFVTGTEKSGTTWLQTMLDAHPQAVCRGEGQFFKYLSPNLNQGIDRYNQVISASNTELFQNTGGFPVLSETHRRYLVRTAICLLLAEYGAEPKIQAVGEKTPNAVRYLDRLELLFPKAKYLFLVRDGRDVALSFWHFNQRHKPEAGSMAGFHEMVPKVANLWRSDLERMEKFIRQFPGQGLLMRYEDLHAQPHQTMEKALAHLGIDASPQAVAACVAAGEFSRLSGGRKRGEESVRSLFRKGLAGEWRAHFDEGMQQAFAAEAGEALARMGYDQTTIGSTSSPSTALP